MRSDRSAMASTWGWPPSWAGPGSSSRSLRSGPASSCWSSGTDPSRVRTCLGAALGIVGFCGLGQLAKDNPPFSPSVDLRQAGGWVGRPRRPAAARRHRIGGVRCPVRRPGLRGGPDRDRRLAGHIRAARRQRRRRRRIHVGLVVEQRRAARRGGRGGRGRRAGSRPSGSKPNRCRSRSSLKRSRIST